MITIDQLMSAFDVSRGVATAAHGIINIDMVPDTIDVQYKDVSFWQFEQLKLLLGFDAVRKYVQYDPWSNVHVFLRHSESGNYQTLEYVQYGNKWCVIDSDKYLNRKKTVLVVDDVSDNLVFVERMLRPKYNVISISNSITVSEHVMKIKPTVDLIISDINMPVVTGFDICRTWSSMVPVILLSATDSEEKKAEAYNCGCSMLMSKPINLLFEKSITAFLEALDRYVRCK